MTHSGYLLAEFWLPILKPTLDSEGEKSPFMSSPLARVPLRQIAQDTYGLTKVRAVTIDRAGLRLFQPAKLN